MQRLVASIVAATAMAMGCNSILDNPHGQLSPGGAGGGGGTGGTSITDGPSDVRGGSGGVDGAAGGVSDSASNGGTGGSSGAGGRDAGPDVSVGGASGAGPGSDGGRDTGPDGGGGTGGASAEGGPDADANPCGAGQKLCNGTCRLTSNPTFGCASSICTACPTGPNGTPACLQGACGFSCTTGFGDCTAGAGCETSLRTSPNCGACNTVCGSLVCGYSSMHCYNPKWADWPMPNSWVSVAMPDGGVVNLPNQRSYDTSSIAGVVIDNVTHLQWQRAVDTTGGDGANGQYTYSQAIIYCANLALDNGAGTWRVPTRIELLSIVDTSVNPSGGAATINATAFPNTPLGFYWTSSLVAGSSSVAWDINFGNGFANNGNPITAFDYVRCVR